MTAITMKPPSAILARLILFEMRKQRTFFLSTCVVIVAGLTVSVIVNCGIYSTGLVEAILGAAAFLTGALPIIAAFLAGSAASSLRRDPDKGAEEVLPLPPHSRPFAAYLSSLAYTLLIFLASVQWLGMARMHDLQWFAYITPVLLRSSGYGTCLLLLLKVHALAFVFSYWLALPVLGSGLAVILAGLDFFVLNNAAQVYSVSYYQYILPAQTVASSFFPRLNFKLIVELVSLMYILSFLSRRLEIGQQLKRRNIVSVVTIVLLAVVWSYLLFLLSIPSEKQFSDLYS